MELQIYSNSPKSRTQNVTQLMGYYPTVQIAQLSKALLERAQIGSKHPYVYAYACGLPSYQDALERSQAAWSEVDEREVFMTAEDEMKLGF